MASAESSSSLASSASSGAAALESLARSRYRSRRAVVFRRLVHHKGAVAGFIIAVALIITALAAPIIATHDPIETTRNTFAPPSRANLMGTDNFGRDIFSRVVYGTRISLRMGIVAVLIGTTAGTLVGLIAGHYGGMTDMIVMRVIDAMMAFPGILLALTIAAVLGTGLTNAMIAVGVSWIPQFARLVRGNVLQVKAMPYVEAARSIGAGNARLMARHVFPNVTTPILVLSTLGIASAILIGASLSFLGVGAQPPTPEWGAILNQGRQYMRQAWWVMTFPGIAITITVMAANLLGDGLRDALDPRMKI
ncbi:MAG: diguanylate cyclase [Chloroflexi bacterium]|nr:MAG: diguanylate cyclase [Chloroflexota bacterium]